MQRLNGSYQKKLSQPNWAASPNRHFPNAALGAAYGGGGALVTSPLGKQEAAPEGEQAQGRPMPMVQDFFDKERVRSPTASENLLVHWTVRVQVPLSPNSYFIQLFLKGNSGTKAMFVNRSDGISLRRTGLAVLPTFGRNRSGIGMWGRCPRG